MPDHKKEIAALKAENKKLKALLKSAVRLLHQSKEYLQHPVGKPAAVQKPKKTAKKKKTQTVAP